MVLLFVRFSFYNNYLLNFFFYFKSIIYFSSLENFIIKKIFIILENCLKHHIYKYFITFFLCLFIRLERKKSNIIKI